MKKFVFLIIFLCLGSLLFAQYGSGVDLGIGFQYGLARVFDDGITLREIKEPGILGTVRMMPGPIGFFGRIGLLFPSSVTEGGLTLTYSEYNYILLANAGFGASFNTPIGDRFVFIVDAGISINNLFYGGSFTDTVDASWRIKIENLGQTYTGGRVFRNVQMKDRYNDWAFGVLGNAAIRFRFTDMVSLELGTAASFDFLRYRSYRFIADFRYATVNGLPATEADVRGTFPGDRVDGMEVTLESQGYLNVFKQFTFIPSISVVFSF